MYDVVATERDDSVRTRRPEGAHDRLSNRRDREQTPAVRYDALIGSAKYRGTKTETELTYEDRVISYTEPETVFRTVREDHSGWQICCCRTLFGWRERCVWCPLIVEKQVADVVDVERQRVERIEHEAKQVVPTRTVEPVVVHSRRPYVKKTFDWESPEYVIERAPLWPVETAENRDGISY